MNHIYYHSKDLDGLTSGAILKEKFPNAQLSGYHYGEPFDTRYYNQNIVMADVTLEPEMLFELAKNCQSFTLIDHHVSAYDKIMKFAEQNNIEKLHGEVNGLIDMIEFPEYNFTYYYSAVLSACEMCITLYPFGNFSLRTKVKYLGQYDTWRKGAKALATDFPWETVMAFQYGARRFTTPQQVL